MNKFDINSQATKCSDRIATKNQKVLKYFWLFCSMKIFITTNSTL